MRLAGHQTFPLLRSFAQLAFVVSSFVSPPKILLGVYEMRKPGEVDGWDGPDDARPRCAPTRAHLGSRPGSPKRGELALAGAYACWYINQNFANTFITWRSPESK